ncbi:Wzz/FepE/Etk N-terminal domain-containing protein [Candidatus Cetobacterium colombiensis]|uniref:Wzz/FepE/Etk N-terminal domain-containing protein n=1 Tax=Candidatus Cetobacterium colombiensis TaxID=3073100 RepID=A0ABU4W8T3_9FUSO|nr:Wzz/FepE/Etk N-terminal domain-containing protein [Candidatus Cetobacterium colombiensis]MDX8335936.1 Wzz/FepE/Etk N-terminal domain-containing protein [Candidatus Cetobacterium colombiensis]
MKHQVSTELRHDDEIDLMELLMILVKEKKTIFITTVLVTLLSLGGALYERNISKKASTIVTVMEGYNEQSLLVNNVLEKVYTENNIREKNEISLDEFRDEFKVTGIIPKEISDKKEFLAKSGETLEYKPTSYKIDLRVGSIGESEKVLKDYYTALNQYYRDLNESKYKFKYFDVGILNDTKYNYEDYLNILEERKNTLKDLIKDREKTRVDYSTYGFGYRKIQLELNNLESIRIQDLKNYLLATNIVRNPDKFQSEFLNRKTVLENKITEKKEEANNYKKLLNSYKFQDENIVVPKGVKVTIGDNQKEKYYVELMDNYLNTENELTKLQQQLDELVFISKNLKTGTEAEQKYILNSLEAIVKGYNDIVQETNILEAKENYINSGLTIKLAAPIEIISNSKAKLILAVGVVMGLFLGVIMAFIKNFYHSFKNFKKGMMVLALFSFVSINGYSKEEITLQFTHKEVKEGLNPDKTPFDLNEVLIKKFLVKKIGLKTEELKNISIEPIFPKDSIKSVENRLALGEKDYLYVPTEYLLTLNLKDAKDEKKIKDEIVKEFPNFYINYFLQNVPSRYNFIQEYSNYRDSLKSLNNLITSIGLEIELRKKNAETKEIFYEYNNLGVELNKIKNIGFRDVSNYLKSNNLVSNINLEKILLDGENRYIGLELKSLKSKENIYGYILKNYTVGEKQASVLESGDISMSSDTGLREKQYIDISKVYLENLNKENSLKIELLENQRLSKDMREPNEEQKSRINQELLEVQNELNDIVSKMVEIELRDYKREYVGSVKVF